MLDKKVMWIKMVLLLGGTLVAGGALGAEAQVDSKLPQATPSIPSELVYPLPAEQVRAVLAQQLLELALANVHPYFNEQWLA